jgi:hypothetical protein
MGPSLDAATCVVILSIQYRLCAIGRCEACNCPDPGVTVGFTQFVSRPHEPIVRSCALGFLRATALRITLLRSVREATLA